MYKSTYELHQKIYNVVLVDIFNFATEVAYNNAEIAIIVIIVLTKVTPC